MNRVEIPLDDITVAAPCHADWNKMRGSDTVRFCQSCEKNVYNLSGMSRTEAEVLIREKEGSLCVRFARRADGTLITDNCPVGLRAIRRRAKWLRDGAVMAFVWMGAVLTIGVASIRKDSNRPTVAQTMTSLRQIQPFKTVMHFIDPPREQGGI